MRHWLIENLTKKVRLLSTDDFNHYCGGAPDMDVVRHGKKMLNNRYIMITRPDILHPDTHFNENDVTVLGLLPIILVIFKGLVGYESYIRIPWISKIH